MTYYNTYRIIIKSLKSVFSLTVYFSDSNLLIGCGSLNLVVLQLFRKITFFYEKVPDPRVKNDNS